MPGLSEAATPLYCGFVEHLCAPEPSRRAQVRPGKDRCGSTHTILDIFAADRPGLLYTVARTLFELELSVSVAKISTYVDQVVDVFYVTDRSGKKIEDEQRLNHIRARLLEEIGSFQRQDSEQMRHW